ncbi:Na+/H+ antiporter subunit E [Camelimonas fluminis]|uniref:Na+/H+ antiporter subunit E n=1 Tax=Camelimonas fluminis TaxID=1576911 RepID=A0ABV7UDY3_9HYPH|nr:Na+/H+ antiporter subunit E [Camelimonas fluminis]
MAAHGLPEGEAGSRAGLDGRAGARKPRLHGMLTLWLVLFAVWTIANTSLALDIALTGAAITGALAWAFTTHNDAWCSVRWTPRGLYHLLAYVGVFLVELVKANLQMLRYVYARRIDINPGIVQVRTRLVSPLGRLALANTIALTPGSLVLALEDDLLFVHWLDVKTTDTDAATEAIVAPFERHLEKVFG